MVPNFWHRISQKFQRRDLEAQIALTRAYRQVFYGNPDRAQQQMVLADLAARSGYYKVLSPRSASDKDLWFSEGNRHLFGVIFGHLSMTPEDVAGLENAARHEAMQIDAQEQL